MRIGVFGNGPLASGLNEVLTGAGCSVEGSVGSMAAAVTADASALCAAMGSFALTVWLVDTMPRATAYRRNADAAAGGVPCLFIGTYDSDLWVGPLVENGRRGCWFCLKTRQFACAPDAVAAIARETEDCIAPVLTASTIVSASQAAASGIATWRGKSGTAPAPGVVSIDSNGQFHRRTLLARSDCPYCAGAAAENVEPIALDTNAAAALLVDPAIGLVRHLSELPPIDIREPVPPVITHCVIADHALGGSGGERCFGKGFGVQDACTSALGEAIERYAARCWNRNELIIAPASALGAEVIDPAVLAAFPDEGNVPKLRGLSLSEDANEWAAMSSLTTGARRLVPAWAVFTDCAPVEGASPLALGTTAGLAAGPTLDSALENALLEVLERDAFATAWLAKLPGIVHEAGAHPDTDVVRLASSYEALGVTVDLCELPVDHIASVFAALLRRRDRRSCEGPAATLGLGAGFDKNSAARRALLEAAQVRRVLEHRLTNPRVRARMSDVAADAALVTDAEDHALFHAAGTHRHELNFLSGDKRGEWEQPGTGKACMQSLIGSLARNGLDVLWRDVTPTDLTMLRVHVVRAIVPGVQPLHFGGIGRLCGGRVLNAPTRLGLRNSPLSLAEVNVIPHPFC